MPRNFAGEPKKRYLCMIALKPLTFSKIVYCLCTKQQLWLKI